MVPGAIAGPDPVVEESAMSKAELAQGLFTLAGIRILRRKEVGGKKEKKEGRRDAPEENLLQHRHAWKHAILATIP